MSNNNNLPDKNNGVGRKGQAWHIIKWFPRFFMMMLIMIFIYFLFSNAFAVKYEHNKITGMAFHNRILYGDVFGHSQGNINLVSGAGRIYYDNFNEEKLNKRFFFNEEESSDEEIQIVRLQSKPLSAKLTLKPRISDDFEEKTIYYNEDDYKFLLEAYITAGGIIEYSKTENAVSVTLGEDESFRVAEGTLAIEVISV